MHRIFENHVGHPELILNNVGIGSLANLDIWKSNTHFRLFNWIIYTYNETCFESIKQKVEHFIFFLEINYKNGKSLKIYNDAIFNFPFIEGYMKM